MNPLAEWLETDGLGGFASGTVGSVRTRRYHALLLHAASPPTGRRVLVNGLDAWVETPSGRFAISAQRYAPNVTNPDGAGRIAGFEPDPWPRWRYRLEDGTEIVHELFAVHGAPVVVLAWWLTEPGKTATLEVRPFLSGRDTHSLHGENPAFRFDAEIAGDRVAWSPYPGVPRVTAISNGRYRHDPVWYRNFQYDEERARGLDWREDLACPGAFRWDLRDGPAVWILSADGAEQRVLPDTSPREGLEALRAREKERRGRLGGRLERAADQYLVRRGDGLSVIAGYPWFSDWGRDAFLALRGLCLATGRLDEARRILLAWAATVSRGMLPNFFPEGGQAAEYNAVDASLWYVVAVHELLRAAEADGREVVSAGQREALLGAVDAILSGYAAGTRFGIRMDGDGLLAAGEPGVQLTWMDARVGERVITPRVGKPVEVQALWINALEIGSRHWPRWREPCARARDAFVRRFWNEGAGHLHDVVDVDHRAGEVDPTLRPNQILAVGGLPFAVLDRRRRRERLIAERVVSAVERELWTPMGLRSLAPREPGYTGRYGGDPSERDSVYHQGTVWPWLTGPFVEAWIRVRGSAPEARRAAYGRFVQPLLDHLDGSGLGHVSEVADGDPPHVPGGAPFQAWSLGELLRLLHGPLAGAYRQAVVRTAERPAVEV